MNCEDTIIARNINYRDIESGECMCLKDRNEYESGSIGE